jgi:hypothetical protein
VVIIIVHERRELCGLRGGLVSASQLVVLSLDQVDLGRAAAFAVSWAGVVFPWACACAVSRVVVVSVADLSAGAIFEGLVGEFPDVARVVPSHAHQ